MVSWENPSPYITKSNAVTKPNARENISLTLCRHHGTFFVSGVLCTLIASSVHHFSQTAASLLQTNDRSSYSNSDGPFAVQRSGGNPKSMSDISYVPSAMEAYVMKHAAELGLDSVKDPSGCTLWPQNDQTSEKSIPSKQRTTTTAALPDESVMREKFAQYLQDLKEYQRLVTAFSLQGRDFTDLRHGLRHQTHSRICPLVDIPLKTVFTDLSWMPQAGFMEPLLPPLRHPEFCLQGRPYLMNLTYLVHDFAAMCRTLTPYSRTIFIDMGASLSFHRVGKPPESYLLSLYEQFGITFDHIYAYEIRPHNTTQVFHQLIPDHYQAAYHWINVGVDWKPDARMNPFTMLKNNYRPEDLIVVKLDVDTASVELPLAKQLLNDPVLQSLVDHFYFEHHVHMKELAPNWSNTMQGNMQESLELFYKLREKGIPAHYWV